MKVGNIMKHIRTIKKIYTNIAVVILVLISIILLLDIFNVIYLDYYLERGLYIIGILIWFLGFLIKVKSDNNVN